MFARGTMPVGYNLHAEFRTCAELCNASRARARAKRLARNSRVNMRPNQLFLAIDFETVLIPREISQIAARDFRSRLKFHEVARQTFRTNSLFSSQTFVDVGAHITLQYFTFCFRFGNLRILRFIVTRT